MSNLPVIRKVEPELNKQLLEDFKGQREGFIQVGPENTLLPLKYEKVVEELRNFEVRPDDTWVVTFPRSGTTLMSELSWLIGNNANCDKAKEIPITVRIPFIDMNLIIRDEVLDEISNETTTEGLQFLELFKIRDWEFLNTAPSPRFIRTHLPIHILPKNLMTCGAKIIYVARNPKDVAVSWYHMHQLVRFLDFRGDFEKFWNYFEKDLTLWAPYWAHFKEGWKYRNNPNLKFIFYEEYSKNPSDIILKVAKFLNKSLTEDQLAKVVDHMKFENFKKNDSVNGDILLKFNVSNDTGHRFIRRGKVGGWVDEFTPELSARADKWIEENLEKTDLRFPL